MDRNESGLPDEWDIALGTNADQDLDAVPDECEGDESMMAGGSSVSSSTNDGSDSDLAYRRELAAWGAFERWFGSADFSGMTEDEIDTAMLAKLDKLGL